MLKTICLHSDILNVLAKCGHGDKVLIADGNYPVDSKTSKTTEKVYLNLTHGIPLVTDVLKVMNEIVEIEKLEVMIPEETNQPDIFKEFKDIVHSVDDLEELNRYKFYEMCEKENVKLAITTGEQRLYANVLLTIGAV